jgi:hypothetical protein
MSYKYLKYKNKYLELKGGSSFTNTMQGNINWRTYKPFEGKFTIDDGYSNTENTKIFIITSWIDYLGNIIKNKIPTIEEFLYLLDISNKTLKEFIKELKEYKIIVTINPYKFDIIKDKFEIIKDKFEIIIPTENIRFDDITNIGLFKMNLSKREVTNLLPMTHVLLKNNYFYSIYYHDASNPNTIHIASIKEILVSTYNYKMITFPWLKDNCLKIINDINSEDYWKQNRHFNIGSLLFKISEGPDSIDINISTLYGGLLEKGSGHLFLCLFLNLINSSLNQKEIVINLKASTFGVMEKFYKMIGFNCNNSLECTANIKDLIAKCNENNKGNFGDIKLILSMHDKYYDKLDDAMEKLLEIMKPPSF